MNIPQLTRLSTLSLTVALAACGGGGGGDSPSPAPTPAPAAATQDVSIQFAAVAGPANAAVACGTPITGLGSVPTNAQLTDLRFYLTNIQLVDDKGNTVPVTLTPSEWQYTDSTGSVALIDLEDAKGSCAGEGTAATNASIKGKVPAGNYVQIKATLGVPEKLSHSDVMAAPAPLDLMAMGWSWQTGRKFAKIELDPVGGVRTPVGTGTTTVSTYPLHLASTNCTGNNDGNDTCAKKNLAQLSFNFNPATQQIALDVAELFATTDIRTNQVDALGCMSATSDLDCPTLFAKVGLDLTTGETSSSAQSVFRAISK